MFDGKSLVRPGMKDARFGEPVVGQLRRRLPCRAIFLTAPLERAPPEIGDMVTERRDGTPVGRHRVVVDEPGDDLLEPYALLGDGVMHAPAQFLLKRQAESGDTHYFQPPCLGRAYAECEVSRSGMCPHLLWPNKRAC